MQEIIVYRNPLEAAVWGSLMHGGAVIPVLIGAIVFFSVFLLTHYICKKIWKGWRHGQRNAIISFAVAIPAAIATIFLIV